MYSQNAITAISSRSTEAVVISLLEEFDIPAISLSDGPALLTVISSNAVNSLTFVSLEVLKEINRNPAIALAQIRERYFGPLYVLSINASRDEFRDLIEHGATDIIDIKDISTLRVLLNTYSLFRQIESAQHTLVALIVEDSASQQKLIAAVLEDKNIQVIIESNVKDAVNALKLQAVDLVITDIHLEGELTGMHLLREICQSTFWQGIPTFAISGVVPNSRVKEYLQLGVRDFMLKPLDVDLFSLRIDNIIRERQTYLKLSAETQRLNEIAYSDSLTELRNRAYLKKSYSSWAEKNDHQFYALMLDMDNLKKINDQIGHDAGDAAIQTTAHCLYKKFQETDIVIRLGGDEFVAIVSGQDDLTIKKEVYALLEQINKMILVGNIPSHASIGVAKITKQLPLSLLLKRVDALMYVAKTSGKNRIEFEF